MPLTATFDPGHNHYPNENVYFFMNDRDRRVRCGVSELALEVFDPQFERSCYRLLTNLLQVYRGRCFREPTK